jgi:hypothetical protein
MSKEVKKSKHAEGMDQQSAQMLMWIDAEGAHLKAAYTSSLRPLARVALGLVC